MKHSCACNLRVFRGNTKNANVSCTQILIILQDKQVEGFKNANENTREYIVMKKTRKKHAANVLCFTVYGQPLAT